MIALAKDKYESNQIINAINECRGDLPLDIFCENLWSELQGDENLATIIGTQSGVGPTRNGGGDAGRGDETPMTMNNDIGVLFYTHGFPNNPLTFKPDMQK